jgi:hypothetical protein
MAVALGVAAVANATPPPPPAPPRPFDDPSIAQRYEEWEEGHQQAIYDAAAKLAQVRIALREAQADYRGAASKAKLAAKEFAAARRRSLESLRELAILYARVKPVASAGDLQRLEERLEWGREWFANTESNTLEILEGLTD